MDFYNNITQPTENNKVSLSVMRCPTCGEKIKYKKGDKEVICMACGNTYAISDRQTSNAFEGHSENVATGTLKIDGIKTSSSALAYIEQFLDSYDWESFAFDSDFTIDELEEVTENLKVTSADDYKTWVACFISTVVPFSKKIEYRSKIYKTIIDEYKKGNLDSYGMYDAYKLVSSSLITLFDSLKERANKYLDYAKKYNLPKDEQDALDSELSKINIKKLNDTIFGSIEEIPEIKEFNDNKEKELVNKLKLNGIDAASQYALANSLVSEGKYVEALDIFYSLENYKDTIEIIDKINKLFVLSSEIFINEGKIYYLNKDANTSKYELYRTDNEKLESKPIVNDIGTVITNYANTLYYFTTSNYVRAINLVDGKQVLKTDDSFDSKKYFIRKKSAKAYFVKDGTYENPGKTVCEIDLKTNKIIEILKNVKSVSLFKSHYVHFVDEEKIDNKTVEKTFIFDLDNYEKYEITNSNIFVVEYFNNKVLYTINNPTNYNKKLFIYDFETREKILLERNINGDCKVVNNKIYYFTVDNLDCKYLITIGENGTNRRELSPYVKEVLFASGDWLYFIKAYKYNTALCKMKLDGSNIRTIASQIDEFVKIDNGYLYYIDDDRDLHKVRMDGSRNKIMCYSVKEVLKIANNSIIYTAEDQKDISSIYSIDFGKEGRRKASYNVLESKLYDDNVVYYINLVTVKSEDTYGNVSTSKKKYLSRLDTQTYQETKIIEIKIPEKSSGCYVASCVYNSYDCPEVWRLRRYRDYYLDSHWWGRLFIKLYYAISPKLVGMFGQKKWFRGPIKNYLDKKLSKLEKQGYSDTPYDDKY